jgi:hypothetical protein
LGDSAKGLSRQAILVRLTQTRHLGHDVIRGQASQFDATRDDVMMVATVARDFLE